MACAGQMIWETAMAGVQRCRENLMTDLQLLGDGDAVVGRLVQPL
jgi:hypothetical protein